MFKPSYGPTSNLYFLQIVMLIGGQVMTKYDFLDARRVILRNVWTDYNLI